MPVSAMGQSEILEPGCGTGNFMRCVPEGMDVHVTGVEIDPVSAGLARVLCPDHTIVAADIEKCEIPEGSFDAAIGNVPYSDAIKIDGVPLHDYMIKRAVAAVRPGGIVAVLTSRYTMDKAREATPREPCGRVRPRRHGTTPQGDFREPGGNERAVRPRHPEEAR